MKVLLIAYACEPNKGSEPGVGWNWVVHLSNYINVTVITRRNNKEVIEKELTKTELREIKFIYHDIETLTFIKNISSLFLKFYYFIWVSSLRLRIESFTQNQVFDIVHFVTFNTFGVIPPLNNFGIKSVWGPIGGGILGHEESFKKISFFTYFKEKMRNTFVKSLAQSNYMKNAISKFDKVIFANSATAKLFGYKNNSLIELETGITSEKFSEYQMLRKSDKKINILASGVFEPRKGFHLLLEALKRVKMNVELNILGEGTLKNYLFDIVSEYRLSNVKFLGKIPFEDVQKYYKDTDIFIFPSLRDTSGNVVLEAMSQGLPIIAFDHQGMHDILTEECGVKIPVTNYKKMVSDLAEAIDKLANDSELRIKMGNASIKRIKENYLWEDKAKRMLEIYREVLNENSPGS